MHPDKKVGLSLGILLIGVTAAFFFRNDVPLDQAQTPQLTDPESLDDQIRRKAQTPYLPSRPTVADQSDMPVVRDADVADVIPQPTDLTPLVAEVVLPNPIRPSNEAPAGRIAPIPHPSAEPVNVDSAVAQANTPQQTNDQPTDPRPVNVIHVVMPKDTLSGLAQQYLGTFRRYREIFEANRDQLDSPDDIREGMKLVIPAAKTASTPQAAPTESAATTTQRSAEAAPADVPDQDVPDSDSAPPRPSFVRPTGVHRLPGRRTSLKSKRSLSQEPPPGLPVVDSFDPDASRADIASRPPEVAGRDSSESSVKATK